MEINTKQILGLMRHGDRTKIASIAGVSKQRVYIALNKENGLTESDMRIIRISVEYLKNKKNEEKKLERKIIKEIENI